MTGATHGLDDMHEWHRSRSIEARRGRGRHEDDRDFVRWCFADANVAAAFAADFVARIFTQRL